MKVVTPMREKSLLEGYSGIRPGNTLCDDVSPHHRAAPEYMGDDG